MEQILFTAIGCAGGILFTSFILSLFKKKQEDKIDYVIINPIETEKIEENKINETDKLLSEQLSQIQKKLE